MLVCEDPNTAWPLKFSVLEPIVEVSDVNRHVVIRVHCGNANKYRCFETVKNMLDQSSVLLGV